MRIGVSGPHGTGKSTLVDELCGRLAGHIRVDEPYFVLEEEGREFEFPPSADDYRAQLRRSLRLLTTPSSGVVFDRTPLDFLAYLSACGVDPEAEVEAAIVRSALCTRRAGCGADYRRNSAEVACGGDAGAAARGERRVAGFGVRRSDAGV